MATLHAPSAARTWGGRCAVSRCAVSSLALVGCAVSWFAAVGCASALPERLEYGLYPSAAMQRDMTYGVYTPPGWTKTEELPLVTLLHGAGDNPHTPDKFGFGQTLDEHVVRGAMPRVVVVVPQGDLGFWENWHNGDRRYRDWVTEELLPHVGRRYHTRPCPEDCHVMGVSMGGAGALSFALAAPERWRSVSVLSAPIFQIDEVEELYHSFFLGLFVPVEDIWGPFDRSKAPLRDVYSRWQRADDLKPSLLLTWGSEDSDDIRRSSRRFENHLKTHHIPARSFEFQGDHSWRSWRDVVPVAIAAQVGASQQGVAQGVKPHRFGRIRKAPPQ